MMTPLHLKGGRGHRGVHKWFPRRRGRKAEGKGVHVLPLGGQAGKTCYITRTIGGNYGNKGKVADRKRRGCKTLSGTTAERGKARFG